MHSAWAITSTSSERFTSPDTSTHVHDYAWFEEEFFSAVVSLGFVLIIQVYVRMYFAPG